MESQPRFGWNDPVRREWRGAGGREGRRREPVLGEPFIVIIFCTVGIANENGGITFFPVQVNVGGQAQAVAGSIQPLSAQALAGSLSSPQVTGTTLQVPGQVAIQQISPGGHQQKQGPPLTGNGIRPRKTSSLSLFFRKVICRVPFPGRELGK